VRKFSALFACAALTALTVSLVPVETTASQGESANPQAECQYFDITGYSLCAEFESFWVANGGLSIFGYPLSDAFEEVNPDTGETYRVQYFERQRFELHPENAGTPYHVLLGRLGAQLFGLGHSEDSMTQPGNQPDETHYFPETGYAIGAEFSVYWSSYGLNLGDPGVSFRESLALNGYPKSAPEMATNADGDTVLTQWFERAVFELHPRDKEGAQVLLRRVGAEILSTPSMETVVSGLNSPRGMTYGPDSALYIAEAGSGGDECIEIDEGPAFGDNELCFGSSGSVARVVGGQLERIVTGLPSFRTGRGQVIGPQGVAVDHSGNVYVTLGYALHPDHRDSLPEVAADMGFLIKIDEDGAWARIADLASYEAAVNPEPVGGIHSNPYGLFWAGDGLMVTDAAGNDLLHVDLSGEITTIAAFAPQIVTAPPGAGLPEGTTVPMASVPASVVQGPDGAFYVGEITGFPFVPGMARIWRVVPGEDPEVYATGLTAVIDLAFDPQGRLYALEAVRGGLLAVDPTDPESMTGALVRVSPDSDHTILVSDGLRFPTSLVIGADGMAYITNFGMVPQQGSLVQLTLPESLIR
jgi:hypothetical protein